MFVCSFCCCRRIVTITRLWLRLRLMGSKPSHTFISTSLLTEDNCIHSHAFKQDYSECRPEHTQHNSGKTSDSDPNVKMLAWTRLMCAALCKSWVFPRLFIFSFLRSNLVDLDQKFFRLSEGLPEFFFRFWLHFYRYSVSVLLSGYFRRNAR